MKTIRYTLTLLSDAEIGSGFGNESVNDVLARDHKERPVLRGSHLKGLIREQLKRIGDSRNWPGLFDELCFGQGGENGDDGTPGLARVPDASIRDAMNNTRTITRTSLTELGVVAGMTLRTTEAVHAGSVFEGHIQIHPEAPAVVETGIRLALLTLEAVGGGRMRGSGACLIDIEGETRSPGEILTALDSDIEKGVFPVARAAQAVGCRLESGKPATLLKLVFYADDPVCCPDTPVVGNNVIQSGLGIPASAVLGGIITRLAQSAPELATQTVSDIRTRAWPLLPCGLPDSTGTLPIPIHVSLSHKMSKLENEQGCYEFKDPTIDPYDWRFVSRCSPLKGTTGVLLKLDKRITLWKTGDMPNLITAHAVHMGERNLFTVKAQAPMVFSGWISLPPESATALLGLLERDGGMTFGKARTIRGGGRMQAEPADWPAVFTGWQDRVFVLQSPAAIPDDWDLTNVSAEETLGKLLHESGWGELAAAGNGPAKGIVTQASCAIRFGWNRQGLGQGVAATKRLRARRVFLPGTVFVLKQAPADLKNLLLRGIGAQDGNDRDGRSQGFGAVLPHPGIASELFRQQPEQVKIKSDSAGKMAMEWFVSAGANGPSPSQISAVAERIKSGGANDAAAVYLNRQKTGRTVRTWDRWKPVFDSVQTAIRTNPDTARKALRTWQDLAIINRKNKED
ncbi:MAG: hypothetical protein R6X19_06905 [Kiritimatiellia bacterium]